MLLTQLLIFIVETLPLAITSRGQGWTAGILEAGALESGGGGDLSVADPDVQTGGDGLVLAKLALGVAIAQQRGVDTHPGPRAGEVRGVGARRALGSRGEAAILAPVGVSIGTGAGVVCEPVF